MLLMPNLLYKNCLKSDEHLLALERRMNLYYEGNILELSKEGANHSRDRWNVEEICKTYAER